MQLDEIKGLDRVLEVLTGSLDTESHNFPQMYGQ
jgi:hypothetical protein